MQNATDDNTTTGDTEQAAPQQSEKDQITYRIDSTRSAVDITYSNAKGGSSSKTVRKASLPWEVTIEASEDDLELGIPSLQAQLNGGGEVTCEILINGESKAKASSEGQYPIIMCQPDPFD